MLESISRRNRFYDLINLQYGVCFGFIFSSFFSFNEPDHTIKIQLGSGINYVIFFALIFYFFLDWALFNTSVNHFEPSIPKSIILSMGIWGLGLITLVPRNSSYSQEVNIILVGIYYFMAGTFKLFFYTKGWYSVSGSNLVERKPFSDGTNLVGGLASTVQIILSSYFILTSSIYIFVKHTNKLMYKEINFPIIDEWFFIFIFIFI